MLSNYEIEKQLGKGTYGVVYKVKKKDDNKYYVLKQIPLYGLSPQQIKEVKLEAQVLSKIKSKYVVKYYDSFEEEEKLNIIMEYCDNGDLNDFIENHMKTKHLLREDLIMKYFIKITLGLADIHKLKILHRDLKSLNIFLKNDDDVRVGDLGVAKILNQTFFAKTFIGTPYYLSPEICEDKPYNDKSDVWALGCILYELCTYRHPFTAKSQGGLILKILNDTPEKINNYYSQDLKNLINEIFNKDYTKRPSCLDILKMKYVMDYAKSLGIFEDIKNSFPDIDKANEIRHEKKDKNKINIHYSTNEKGNINNIIKVKPIIIKNSSKKEPKKRPTSGFGLFGRKGIVHKNIKFNEIGYDRKKNDVRDLYIPNNNNQKKGRYLPKNIKISNKDKNIVKCSKNSKQVRKKAIVSPKKLDKEKEKNSNILLKEAEFFQQKKQNNKINVQEVINNVNSYINNNTNKQDNLSILNTKVLNNLANKDIEKSIFNQDKNSIYDTKDLNSVLNNQDKSIFNEINNNKANDNNNDKAVNETETKIEISKNNYSIDSKKESFLNKEQNEQMNNNNINEIIKETNQNVSIESDIYKTCERDKYIPKKEEPIKKDVEITKETTQNTEGSLNLAQLITDFSKNAEETINNATLNEFKIIENNEGIKDDNMNIQNIDNNKSISDESDNEDKNYFSDDDKYEDEEEKVKEINIMKDKDEEEKKKLEDELNQDKEKIEKLKKEIAKLIGEEKYKYIMEICSSGIKDKKQEEAAELLEKFINENCNEENKEKIFEIQLLFNLELQYYKKQLKFMGLSF